MGPFQNRRFAMAGLVVGALSLSTLSGCVARSPAALARVSQPNMVFSQAGAWSVTSRLSPQIESGRAGVSGAQAAGCTTCR